MFYFVKLRYSLDGKCSLKFSIFDYLTLISMSLGLSTKTKIFLVVRAI